MSNEDRDGKPIDAAVRPEQETSAERRAAELLKGSDGALSWLLQQLPIIVWSVDRELRFSGSIGAGLGTLGLEPGSLHGVSLFEFFETTDRDKPEIRAHLRALEGTPGSLETVWSGRSYLVHVVPLANQAGVSGALGLALDVTDARREERERRERESLYRLITDHAQELINIVDLQGRYVYVNPSVRQVLGYEPEALMGQDVLVKIHPDDQALAVDALQRLGAGEPSIAVLLRMAHADGSWRWLEASGKVFEYHGKPHVLGLARDVTERRRLEAELFQSQKLESLGRVAGGLTHDFKNLLTVIIANAESLERTLGKGSIAGEEAANIREAAHRANDVARRLLSFARRQPVDPKIVDVNALLVGFSGLLRSMLGARIELDIQARARGTVKIDPAQFEQLILNLALNAKDAIRETGRLSIGTRDVTLGAQMHRPPELPPGEYVLVEVIDTGEGMSEEVLERVFEPFFSTKEPSAGTGLGLATCHGIVRLAGGQISVRSQPGAGARVEILLPRTDEKPGAAATPATSEAPKKRRVLVVEDEPLVRSLVERVLGIAGFEVLAAGDGVRARALAGQEPLDLLVSDVVLPDVSGPDLVRELRESAPGLPVLLTSGYAGEERLILDHNTRFLPKPFTTTQILALIRELIGA